MGTAADGERTLVEVIDPLIGALLDGRFRIDYQLAAGGFGAIYRATDVRADAQVALKVLHPKLAGDPNVTERFRREGKMLASLRDPHTITAYEIGEAADGTLYIVMELLHGVSLYERFRAEGRLPWRRVLHIARGVCSSLAEAHAVGIVHRDLKPANIHLETRGGDPDFVKVLDFGIAKIVQGGTPERTELTQAGQMIGTRDYMSPEQMVGGELKPQSDIYTLGIVLYEVISGRTPFAEAQSPTAILAAVLTQTPALLSAYVDVPPALDRVIARCLQRDPAHRFAEIGELADALAEVAAQGEANPNRWIAQRSDDPEAPTIPTTPAKPTTPSIQTNPIIVVAATSGFEDEALTTDETRVDVRVTNSSEPVLDARGPRIRPGALGSSPALPPPLGPARALHALGSQHALETRRARPVPGGRGSQPMIETPWERAQGPVALAPGPAEPAPLGYFQPHADAAVAEPRYGLLTSGNRDQMMRRIIWWVVLFLVSTVVTLLATR